MEIMSTKEEEPNKIYKELIDLVGKEATYQIYDHYKGLQIVFPIKFWDKQYVKRQVQKEFNGKNIKQLARKYQYSERWVRKTIAQQRKEEKE